MIIELLNSRKRFFFFLDKKKVKKNENETLPKRKREKASPGKKEKTVNTVSLNNLVRKLHKISQCM